MHRPAWCKQLQDVACVQRVLLAYSKARPLNYADVIVQASDHQRRTYVPLASAAGWEDYYKRLWPGFEDFILVLATELKQADPRVEYGLMCMMQDTHSRPLTIVSALEVALPDIAQRRELVVHVAAASWAEWDARGALEDVLHFFPALRSLTMVYAGPEIPPDLAADGSVRAQNFACASCNSTGRRRKSVYFHGVHHDFMKSPEYTRHPPDLVIAFNTGFSEIDEDSWTPTLDALLDSGIPTAFTAYSLTEAKMEEDVLAKKGARFIVPVGENKWRGGSARTPNAHPDTLTYTNTAWYVVRGRV
jgi:splicing suppressor protein 51